MRATLWWRRSDIRQTFLTMPRSAGYWDTLKPFLNRLSPTPICDCRKSTSFQPRNVVNLNFGMRPGVTIQLIDAFTIYLKPRQNAILRPLRWFIRTND